MRVGLWLVLALLCDCVGGCVDEKLALAPPPGVNFAGVWQLDEADSDDLQRITASENAVSAGQGGASPGGGGGRGQGRGGRGGAPGMAAGGPVGPAMPAFAALADGLRWPGKQLDIKQVAGVVTMTSGGITQLYQPVTAPHHEAVDRDAVRDRRGDGPPPVCGWDGRILVVTADNPEVEHAPFEQRYSLSDDGQQLIEIVAFKGGRSGGFTVSRVWNRVP